MNQPTNLSLSMLVIGNNYNFKAQSERLVYIGFSRGWHQFALTSNPADVWAEVLPSDVHMLEITKESTS